VKGLDPEWTSADLLEIFDQYGPILSAKVSIDKVTNKSKGYGYVRFASVDSANKAIKHSQTGVTPYLAFHYRPKRKEE
jgi:RNA recognition motif-containing protein